MNLMDGVLKRIKLPLALASALFLSWISMHLLLCGLGLGITVSEMQGRASQDYLADLDRASWFTLVIALAAQILIAWSLSSALRGPLRRVRPMIRFCVGFVAGVACTTLFVSIAISTGGALVEPFLEHGLNKAVRYLVTTEAKPEDTKLLP